MKNLLNSRRGRIAAIVGGLVGLAGIALAAILISATISGGLTVNNRDANFRVAASGTVGTGGMDCTKTGATGRNIRIDAAVTRYTGPDNQSEVPEQQCVVNIRIENAGDVPLTVNRFNLTQQPAGLAIVPTGPTPLNIPVGGAADYRAELRIPKNAAVQTSAIAGELEFAGGQ